MSLRLTDVKTVKFKYLLWNQFKDASPNASLHQVFIGLTSKPGMKVIGISSSEQLYLSMTLNLFLRAFEALTKYHCSVSAFLSCSSNGITRGASMRLIMPQNNSRVRSLFRQVPGEWNSFPIDILNVSKATIGQLLNKGC